MYFICLYYILHFRKSPLDTVPFDILSGGKATELFKKNPAKFHTHTNTHTVYFFKWDIVI